MTSQQEGDVALAEHREVMAAHYRDCVTRISSKRYEALLSELCGVLSCPETTTSPSPLPSSGAL